MATGTEGRAQVGRPRESRQAPSTRTGRVKEVCLVRPPPWDTHKAYLAGLV